MRRFLDLLAVCAGLVVAAPVLVLIAIAIRITSPGPVLYWSDRVGQHNRIFRMPKFRTMHVSAPTVPTHLLDRPERHLTPIGGFLRKSSLDELPQLLSILRGDITLVGPRPALYNQQDLISLRMKSGVDELVPGLTGWAQVNGRDALTIEEKSAFDEEYLHHRSLALDLGIIMLTIAKVVRGDGVAH